MQKKIIVFLFIILIVSCSKITEDIEPQENIIPVATVNGEVLGLKQFKSIFNEDEWKNMSISDKKNVIEDWVNLTLLAQEADKIGISENDYVKSKIDNAIKKIKVNSLISYKINSIKINEDDLFEYYKIHKARYSEKVQKYRLQRIFIKELDMFNKVKEDINSKKLSFTEAAEQYSEENFRNNSGYVGYITKEDIPNSMWNKLVNLKKYYYTTMETNDGFYFFRFTDTKNLDKEKTFPEVREQIKEELIKEKQNTLISDLLDEIKQGSQIEISY